MNFDVLIIGGGTAGITVAARLKNSGRFKSIGLIDPSDIHYYQPLWTLVGAGLLDKVQTTKPMRSVIPKGVEWIHDEATELLPDENKVKTTKGEYSYKYLIVATGIIPDWGYAKGLKETIGKNNVNSVYTYETASSTFESIKHAGGGNMIFTMPGGILKCGGAPQKIMWLAEDYISRHKNRSDFTFHFKKEGENIFGIPKYTKVLQKLVEERNIQTGYHQKLIAVDGPNRKATFQNLQTQEESEIDFELLHVCPHFKTHDFIASSKLANEKGEISVDKFTLQSQEYPNVFSLGDCSSLPCGKTGAAIRKQAPVLVANLIAFDQSKPLTQKYHGYTACPILTRHNRVVLAEFDYDGNVVESFPMNQAKESFLMFLFKRYGLPFLYWKLMLKGRI